MKTTASVLFAVLLALAVAPRFVGQPHAQSSSTNPAVGDKPTFEVASIKPSKADERLGPITRIPGRFNVTTTVRSLMAVAYHLTPGESVTRVAGAPSWIDKEDFDVDAEAQGKPTMDQLALMLQSLLADRFKLALHHETRQIPIYALIVARHGKLGPDLKLHSEDAKCVNFNAQTPAPAPLLGEKLTAPCGGLGIISGRPPALDLSVNNATMDMLTAQLDSFVDRPIANRTGLAGKFDMTVEFAFAFSPGEADGTADASIPSDPTGPPSLFTALQEQLGLKLAATKGPVDVLVIDHVEEPSPN